jgi:uncharacterized RDD family membrane protein YckC
VGFGVTRSDDLSSTGGLSLGAITALTFVITILLIAYEVVLLGTQGATVGKLVLGIKVVRKDGRPLTIQDAAKRHSPSIGLRVLGLIPLGITSALSALGLLALALANTAMVFSNGESLYDKVGDTRVIKAK